MLDEDGMLWVDADDAKGHEFIDAAAQGDLDLLKAALTPSTNVDARDRRDGQSRGEAPLHRAIRSNHEHIVGFLLALGADVELMVGETFAEIITPLTLAVDLSQPRIVSLLLDAGADAHKEVFYNEGAKGPLIELVFRCFPVFEKRPRETFETLDLLLKQGIDINARGNGINNSGSAMLHAIETGKLEAVKGVMDRGGDLASTELDPAVLVLLAVRSSRRDTALLKYFLEDLKMKDEDSRALSRAVLQVALYRREGWDDKVHFEMLRMLLDRQADRKTPGMSSALCIAAGMRSTHLVELLLEEGVDVNGVDLNGRTALLAAASNGGIEMINLLLDRGADIHCRRTLAEKRFAVGNNVLHDCAAAFRADTVVKALLSAGADANARNVNDSTPFITWAGSHYVDIYETAPPADTMQAFEMLLDASLDINAVNKQGNTALHLLAARPGLRVGSMARAAVKILVERGARVDLPNLKGKTAAQVYKERLFGVSIEDLLKDEAEPLQYTKGHDIISA